MRRHDAPAPSGRRNRVLIGRRLGGSVRRMLAQVTTFAIDGIEPRRVTVEVDVRPGLPAFAIVGLGDRSVREARERVRGAIQNSRFKFPQERVTVNLAPAFLHKHGPGFDLAIACGILAASGQVPAEALARFAVFGELGLDGSLRPCNGALAVAEGVLRAGLDGVIVPWERVEEAAIVDSILVGGAGDLGSVAAVLRGDEAPDRGDGRAQPEPVRESVDLADVRGHVAPIEALVVAAAGGHNVLFSGPPGTGKTMLARRLPSILPPLTMAEALEVTRIQSIAGLRSEGGLARVRPFRAPHHNISLPGLIGGGAVPSPGEVSLAHHGVLFLDEVSEFPRSVLEGLRQPLEDGRVAVVRDQRVAVFPTRFMLVASTNPCPCGYHPQRRCRCTESDLQRHRRRLSGPLLDRIDLLLAVGAPSAREIRSGPATTSLSARERVAAARALQLARLDGTGATCNAHMDAALVRRHVRLEPGAERVLHVTYEQGAFSARGRDRVLRVARTIADLDASETVTKRHLLHAIGLRHDAAAAPEAVA
jgi:magnesium chelatase family protein